VQGFPLAAAAEAAGYRACLRCRPYRTQPSIWSQAAPELICRAVRLIIDGVLDEMTEDDLGAVLGISGRHLRRMFVQYLGLTPDYLARSTRTHFARRLLDDSDLSIAEVAFAAGFGSIRQFNRASQEIFRAAPGELRARRRAKDRIVVDGGIALRLAFESALDWPAMLDWMRARAIPGVEHVTEDRYFRTVVIDGDPGVLDISFGGPDHLVLRAHLPHWKGLIHIAQRTRRIFGLDADVAAANRQLRQDPLVGHLVASQPGIRPPGTWDPFETGVEGIVRAHSSAEASARIMGEIASQYGRSVPGLKTLGLTLAFPSATALVSADLLVAGLDQPSRDAIRALARRVMARMGRQAAAEPCLADVMSEGGRGADYLAWRLGDPDAFPGQEQALLHAAANAAGRVVSPQQTVKLAEAWRPFRAHAASFLLLADGRAS
jgi:AraC family transcriptional regulator, regulatory protein of adaptative response / DNA-3-methyladenine glycosylase II